MRNVYPRAAGVLQSQKVAFTNPFEIGNQPAAPKNLLPFPFQLDAAAFALRRRYSYLALDPGLGKTIVAALILNQLPGFTAYYVCPPFLVSNTLAEFSKWCFDPRLILWPDSLLHKTKDPQEEKRILFVDEAHRFKNEKAQRTKTLLDDLFPQFDRVVFMSGTPLPNARPVELWPIIKRACPESFDRMGFFSFARKFCDAKKTRFGWDFSGFTNQKEFKGRLTQNFMLRLKKDVLNLPPKMEGLLTVGDKMPPMVSKIEKEILKKFTGKDLVKTQIASNDTHFATYLRMLGKYKVKYVIPFLESLLKETKENILVFAIHKAVISGIAEALAEFKPQIITGETPVKERQIIINDFKNSVDMRILLGNIQACGVGFTINKVHRVVFVEHSWTHGDNQQAADRAHRIGQDKTILVQYVVLAGSVDRKRMELLLDKRNRNI
jgi:SWI/SNF-related matrix-associated actin-dependent regulator 1 of chromatin subfamily A